MVYSGLRRQTAIPPEGSRVQWSIAVSFNPLGERNSGMNCTHGLAFTWHAEERMRTLKITESEVCDTVHRPFSTYPGGPNHGPGRLVYVGEHILVVVADATHTVVTVKLRSARPYVHGVHDRFNYPDAGIAA